MPLRCSPQMDATGGGQVGSTCVFRRAADVWLVRYWVRRRETVVHDRAGCVSGNALGGTTTSHSLTTHHPVAWLTRVQSTRQVAADPPRRAGLPRDVPGAAMLIGDIDVTTPSRAAPHQPSCSASLPFCKGRRQHVAVANSNGAAESALQRSRQSAAVDNGPAFEAPGGCSGRRNNVWCSAG